MEKNRTRQKMEKKDILKFIKMWNDGASCRDIMKEFNFDSMSSVYSAKRRLGLPKRRVGRKRRESILIDKIISLIRERGVCTKLEIARVLPIKSQDYLSTILRKLVLNKEISAFSLKIGGRYGAQKHSSNELFNGFGGSKKYYYVDKNQATKFIVEHLKLNRCMASNRKMSITSYLRRCLRPDLFELVYKTYASVYGLRRLPKKSLCS